MAGHGAGAETGDNVVCDVVAAVELQRQAELARADPGVERRQVVVVHGLLGQQGMARKRQELIEVG